MGAIEKSAGHPIDLFNLGVASFSESIGDWLGI
jgi:hypothetical protein